MEEGSHQLSTLARGRTDRWKRVWLVERSFAEAVLHKPARFCMDPGTSKKPLTIEFPMGALGQAPATVDNLALFVRTAREKLGVFRFAGCAMGRQTIAIQAAALAMGGDARVGMEDSLFVGKGQLATSNAEQVKEVVQIADDLGREIATPDEARNLLGLKGPDKVDF